MIGMERLTNYGLQIPSREQFFREVAANLPARPEYFLKDEQVEPRRCDDAGGNGQI